jgi:hypothetical protein
MPVDNAMQYKAALQYRARLQRMLSTAERSLTGTDLENFRASISGLIDAVDSELRTYEFRVCGISPHEFHTWKALGEFVIHGRVLGAYSRVAWNGPAGVIRLQSSGFLVQGTGL